MFVDFDRVFRPTPEQIQRQLEMVNKFIEEEKKKPRPNLVPDYEDGKYGLLMSEPFQPFYGDCTYCDYYCDGRGMTTGGECTNPKTKIRWCGYGFTCDKFERNK